MKVLFLTVDGTSLGLAMKVKAEGHLSYLHPLHRCKIGEGLVERPSFSAQLIDANYRPIEARVRTFLSDISPDIVVCDSPKLGALASFLREQSYRVIGASVWSSALSHDIKYARKIMKACNIPTSDTVDARKESCVIANVEIWWNGVSSTLCNLQLYSMYFMNHDVGPKIGYSGCVTRAILLDSPLAKRTISCVERLLKKVEYRGPIAISIRATSSSVCCYTFSTSIRPSTLEVYKGSVTKLLVATVNGSTPEGALTNDVGMSVLFTIPPFPNNTEATLAKIGGVTPSNIKHIWLIDTYLEGSILRCAGESGNLGYATARGRDVVECRRRTYRTVGCLDIDSLQYRTDIGTPYVKHANKHITSREKMLLDWGLI